MSKPNTKTARSVVEAIDRAYAKEDRGEARCYIGASMVGTDCIAKMALSMRGYPDDDPDPKLKRIFHAGHKIEDWVVRDLKRAGYDVMEKDDMTGRQWRREWLNGHVVCNADGLIKLEHEGIEFHAILEIKSMNANNFGNFKKHGVKVSHRGYYRQMMMMMAMFTIPTAFFVAYCKDNSEYHAELVGFDQEEWDERYVKIQAALDGQANRVSAEPEDWRCKGCFKRTSCWQTPELEGHCRFCRFSFANQHGGWSCKKTGQQTSEVCNQFEMFKPDPKA